MKSVNMILQKEKEMDQQQALSRRLESAGWGAFFVWWGVTELFPSLPEGMGAIGIGLILLGLNAARSQNGLPTSGFTTTLGILALVLGGLELTQLVLDLPFELPVFAILLIVLGLIILVRALADPASKNAPSI
jgi:hypothetical protein